MINSLQLLVHLRDGLLEHGGKLRWVEVTDALSNGRSLWLCLYQQGLPHPLEMEWR